MKFVIATLLGALVLFLSGFVSHEVVGWHHGQFKRFSDEGAVGAALAANAAEPGLYVLPHVPAGATPEEMEAAMDKLAEGPWVFGVVRSGAAPFSMGANLGYQFGCVLLTALCLCGLVSFANQPCYGRRVALCALAGLANGAMTHLPRHIWYEFPLGWAIGSWAEETVGFVLAGFVIAKLLAPEPGPTSN